MSTLNQRKCPDCGTWNNTDHDLCQNCGALINPEILHRRAAKARKEHHEEKVRAREGRFSRRLRAMRESRNPIAQIVSTVVGAAFQVYLAVLSFFIWLIAFLSG